MRNKLQIALILISLLFIKIVKAQLIPNPIMDYVEKTMEIKQPFDTAHAFKKINVYTFSTYRLYINKQAESNLLDSSFYAKSIQNRQNYLDKYTPDTMNTEDSKITLRVVKENDADFHQSCSDAVKTQLNKYVQLWPYRIYPVKEDSIVITSELAKMKQTFKTSAIDNYSISNELAQVLSKKSGDIAIILDNILYVNYIVWPGFSNAIALYRVYMIDLRTRKLVYYKYISFKTLEPLSSFYCDGSALIPDTKYYFKANKKYWKKKGVKLNKYYVPEQ